MRTVRVDEDWFSDAVAEDMLWHSKHAEDPKTRKAALRMALYYMTYEEAVQYLGSKEEAEEYWNG